MATAKLKQGDWRKDEFSQRFFSLLDDMCKFIRKVSPIVRRKVNREVNYTQAKHSRRRRS